MCEFGLLKNKGIVGFTDGIKQFKAQGLCLELLSLLMTLTV